METPKELVPKILEMLSVAKENGKIKKGVNETTKSVERGTAKLVILAEDVTPKEIVVHLPSLCADKGIPCANIPTKKELGEAIGLKVPTSSLAIEDGGNANETLADIVKKLPKAEAK